MPFSVHKFAYANCYMHKTFLRVKNNKLMRKCIHGLSMYAYSSE